MEMFTIQELSKEIDLDVEDIDNDYLRLKINI